MLIKKKMGRQIDIQQYSYEYGDRDIEKNWDANGYGCTIHVHIYITDITNLSKLFCFHILAFRYI